MKELVITSADGVELIKELLDVKGVDFLLVLHTPIHCLIEKVSLWEVKKSRRQKQVEKST